MFLGAYLHKGVRLSDVDPERRHGRVPAFLESEVACLLCRQRRIPARSGFIRLGCMWCRQLPADRGPDNKQPDVPSSLANRSTLTWNVWVSGEVHSACALDAVVVMARTARHHLYT